MRHLKLIRLVMKQKRHGRVEGKVKLPSPNQITTTDIENGNEMLIFMRIKLTNGKLKVEKLFPGHELHEFLCNIIMAVAQLV